MSTLSSTSYVLPPSRPGDPLRFKYWEAERQAEGDSRACAYSSCSITPDPPSSPGSTKHSPTSTPPRLRAETECCILCFVLFYTEGCPSGPSDDSLNRSLTAPTVKDVSLPQHPRIEPHQGNWIWREGATRHAHPSIILLDLSGDAHYFYAFLLSHSSSRKAHLPSTPAFPLPLPPQSSSPHGHIPWSSDSPPPPPPPPRSPSGNQKLPSDLFDFVK
jgi:hypothetical protein